MNISEHGIRKLNCSIDTLKYLFGLFFIVVGVDKFLLLLTNWHQSIASVVLSLLPVEVTYVIYAIGVLQILIGLYILFRCACSGGLIAAIYFAVAALNAFLGAHYYLGALYILVAAAGYVLSKLVSVKKQIS